MTEFARVYELYFRDVNRYLLAMCHSESEAEELTAETFFKALRAIDSFRGDCDIKLWLLKIAKNCFISSRKKYGRNESIEDGALDNVQSETGVPEQDAVSAEEARSIRDIVHSLPEPGREVFMWRVYGELSFGEIGRMFGKTESWACVTFHRTRNLIRKRMESEEYDE